jgi:hypothetical protein
MIRKLVLLVGCALLLSPAAARADWLFTPQLGGAFGNGSGFTYGASLGWVGAGKFGWEVEWASTPNIIDTESSVRVNPLTTEEIDLIDDSARSLMFNAIVGGPKSGANNAFRPYFSGGLGWARATVQSDELLFDETSNKFAFDLGGGVMTYFHNVGVRGDIRYYQTMSSQNVDNALGLDLGDYDYWRGTIGVTFRW